MECAEHIETLIQDDKFIDVVTPDGYHYEFKDNDMVYLNCWKLVRNNALDCSNIELESILKLAKYSHSTNIESLKYLWSGINKFINVYGSFLNIYPSIMILQTISELEVLMLKLRKEFEDKFK